MFNLLSKVNHLVKRKAILLWIGSEHNVKILLLNLFFYLILFKFFILCRHLFTSGQAATGSYFGTVGPKRIVVIRDVRLAEYIPIINSEKIHHTIPTILPDTDLKKYQFYKLCSIYIL